jgi:hypothetical protein
VPDPAEDNVYICPAGERLGHSFTTQEHGLVLHRYLTNVCRPCAIKHRCTTGKERRITRWEHEHILEVVQRRLDEHLEKMRQRRETVQHPFGTLKMRKGGDALRMKTLPRLASEMALTELFVAVAMADQAERASAEIASVRFHLTPSTLA